MRTLLTLNICLMCIMQYLGLSKNSIGDAGLTALNRLGESGALASLKQLYLYENSIGDDGLKALAEACASGALDNLKVSWRPTAMCLCF